MTDPTVPPAESRAQRRARLLRETRRAEQSINESLVDHSESEQDIRRRRIDAEIEKSFPGVTEDEQTLTGMYEPDARYLSPGHTSRLDYSYDATHEPMRRRLHLEPGSVSDYTTNDPTLGGEVPEWTEREETEYQERKDTARQHANLGVTGTGEWARSLSPEERAYWSGYGNTEDQEAWVGGFISAPHNVEYYEVPSTYESERGDEGRTQLFEGGAVPELGFSQQAPYDIDKRNVREWANNHYEEVAKTGISDTKWKQRFDELQEDVKNTIVPINPQNVGNQNTLDYETHKINATTEDHLDNLNKLWTQIVSPRDYRTADTSSSGSRRQIRRANRPRRRNIEGVAVSFATQSDRDRGATTGRENLTHYPNHSRFIRSGRLDHSRLRRDQVPILSDTNAIYSYDTPIAWRQRNGNVIVPTQRYSMTTNRHQRAVHNALTDAGYHSPQQIANNMMMAAYQQDRHKQTAGSPVGFKHYVVEHGAHDYIPNEEEATSFAHGIANARYDTIRAKQRENAAASGRRPRNSRKPFTRRQQLRLEDAGQLRLPFEGVMPDADRVYRYDDASGRGTYQREETYAQRNKKIMQYPITLGYSPQARPNVED